MAAMNRQEVLSMARITTLLTVLLVVSVVQAHAQSVELGLKGGPNLGTVSGTETFGNARARVGLMGGAFAVIWADRAAAFQPEILFSSKGVKVQEQGLTSIAEITYLDVPLLVRVAPQPRARTRLELLGGPYVSLKLGATVQQTSAGASQRFDVAQFVGRSDFGLVIGAGVRTGRSSIELRTTQGLHNINASPDPFRARNRVFSLMYGVRL
jgi:hypothetical protein